MTTAPDTLKAARNLLLQRLDIHPTGNYPADLDPAEVGIVGDTAHAAKGTSYHLGKDQLTSTAYSRKTARDKAGLSNAASAVDVGEFRIVTAKGTFTQRDLAVWSVEQCQMNAPDTRDTREIIYSPDGKKVLRYDRERGYASEPRTGEADDSHLWHDHYSQYRDAEGRYTLRDHFARWLRTIGATEEDDMFEQADRQLLRNINTALLFGGPSCGPAVDAESAQNTTADEPYGKVARDFKNGVVSQLAQVRAGQKPSATDVAALKAVLMDPEYLAAVGKAAVDAYRAEMND